MLAQLVSDLLSMGFGLQFEKDFLLVHPAGEVHRRAQSDIFSSRRSTFDTPITLYGGSQPVMSIRIVERGVGAVEQRTAQPREAEGTGVQTTESSADAPPEQRTLAPIVGLQRWVLPPTTADAGARDRMT